MKKKTKMSPKMLAQMKKKKVASAADKMFQ